MDIHTKIKQCTKYKPSSSEIYVDAQSTYVLQPTIGIMYKVQTFPNRKEQQCTKYTTSPIEKGNNLYSSTCKFNK